MNEEKTDLNRFELAKEQMGMGYALRGHTEKITPPVAVGDILKLGVTRFGEKGDPIMIYNHYIIFLKEKEKRKIQLNELIEIQIMKVFPKFAFAERTNEK